MARRKSLKLSTPQEVRKALARVANMLINEEIEPRYANALILCCNAILNALRTDEQDRKIAELQMILGEVLENRRQ